MNQLYTDKTYLKVDKINSHVETKIIVSWDYDQSPEGDFDFGDEIENAKYLKRFESGELMCIVIRVEAYAEGEQGTDYLGMCHVKASNLESDVRNIIAEHDMKHNACVELRDNILSRAQTMKKFIEAQNK